MRTNDWKGWTRRALGGGVALALGAAISCSSATDAGTPGAGGGAASGAGGGAASGAGGGAASGTGGILGVDAGGDGGPTECPNVDILFVIDSSGSMADQQQSLIASFGGFVAGIQQKLSQTKSYHVGITTTSDYQGNRAGCAEIGNLITQTSGPLSSATVCTPFASGKAYLDENEPDLALKFACAAKVGTGGSDDERMARAVMNALEPARNGTGGCNEGFSRPDSLLVLVLITDEDDVDEGCDPFETCSHGSGGTPDEWAATVVAHKGGYAQNIVVLSLLGLKADNACGAVPASKLIGFTNRFQNSSKGDVCSASFDQFFLDALPVIDTACVNYVPPR
ncbi:MAG: VWA domain-containing protein [Polyangiaceae bacterium]|nr:VWA domain-containing protein [Polyangiaceae bacterium]